MSEWKDLQVAVVNFIKRMPTPMGEWRTLMINILCINENETIITMPMFAPLYKDEWISVKDRLPLYKECILFYSTDKCHGVTFGCYRGKDEYENDWFTDYSGFSPKINSVTHWQPLPEAPK